MVILMSCQKYEDVNVNIEDLPSDKKDFLLGDSTILRGENLHKVTGVSLLKGSSKIDVSHLNLHNTNSSVDTRNWKENELLLRIPYLSELLGNKYEVVLEYPQNTKDGEIYLEEKSGKEINILAPSIRSISSYEFNDKEPTYIILDNFKSEYSGLIQFIQYMEREDYNGNPDYYWQRASGKILSDDSISIEDIYRNGPVFIYFNWRGNSGDNNVDDIRDSEYDYLLEIDSLKMYHSYDLPTDQVYAPGSFMLITGDHTDILEVFDEAEVGGYPAKYGYYWPGEIGMIMPTTIPFTEGDRFEMVLPKEEGYLNFDNSHNEIELVHGNYRVVDEDESDIFFETNVYYRGQFISYAIVSSESDTVWYDYRETNEYETSSGVNFGYKIQKNNMPLGNHQLLLYTDDKNYQLKPAGDISFSVK
jgi:hypothetical protein